MQVTSDDVQFEEMNLWLIDDRLAYHQFLSSDQPMRTLPVLESDVTRRMDIAIFDKLLAVKERRARSILADMCKMGYLKKQGATSNLKYILDRE